MFHYMLKLLFVLMCSYRFKCKLTKLHLRLLTCKCYWTIGAMRRVLLLGWLLFPPPPTTSHLLGADNGVVIRIPAINLLFDGTLTLLSKPTLLHRGLARGGPLVVFQGEVVVVPGDPLMTLLFMALVG